MKMIPTERAVYLRGHSDGDRGHPPQSKQYTGRMRLIYEAGYGKGYDTRYREDAIRKQHGNKRMGL